MTYRLLTRYTRDDFDTLAEAQWMLRHLAWREVDGAWLGAARGRIEASIYGIDDEEDNMTTYINPETTTDLMDRAWPIARAYCRATWAIGGQPELSAAHALSHGYEELVTPLRTAIYELCQQGPEA